MSRPESPLRNNLTEDETIKKLKLMLIKEKRINKENSKLINDLNFDIEAKSKENVQLINQIQRLSENIGYLQENESSNQEEIKVLKTEILNLNNKSNEKNENNRLNEAIQIEKDGFMLEINAFKAKICHDINELIHGNQIFPQKQLLSEQEELNVISTNIVSFVKDLCLQLNAQIESNSLLQDGIDKLVFKCNDLESIIANQMDKNKGKDWKSELEQKDEQIKRLEELIEDNRNISRALETERDQLQNDLVDLRERHEEKEGYLMEEYREAKQNLESYRIFNDKESAYKVNEIDRLRKLIDQYQQETTKPAQEKSINDCGFCREFELLMKKLKERFEIVDERKRRNSFCHEEIIGKIIEKFDTLQSLFNVQIDLLQRNEEEYRIKVENIQNRMEYIEEKYGKTNKQLKNHYETQQEVELSENIQTNKSELLKIKKSNENLLKENNRFVEIFNKIGKLVNIDCRIDPNDIIDYIGNSIEKTENLIKQINQYKSEINNITENNNKLLIENQSLQLLKSINENLTQTIEELHLTNISYEKEAELLKQDLLEKKSEINNISENHNKLLIENQSLQILKSINDNYEKEVELLKQDLLEKQSEINNIRENHNKLLIENQSLQIVKSINENSETEKELLNKISLEKTNDKIESISSKFTDSQEDQDESSKHKRNLEEIINNIKEILNIDESLSEISVIDEIKKLMILSKETTVKINEITDKYNETYNKKNQMETTIQMLESKIKSMENDLQNKIKTIESIKIDLVDLQKSEKNDTNDLVDNIIEKLKEILNIDENSPQITVIEEIEKLIILSKDLTETINNSKLQVEKIKEILNIDEFSSESNIIDQIIILKTSINQYKLDIESINGKYNNQLMENKSLIDKLADFETEFNELQLNSADYKKEIELLNKQIEEKTNIIENVNSDLLKYKESNFNEIIDKLREVFNIDSSSDNFVIIDYVRKSLSQSEYMTDLINQYQSEIETIKEKSNNLSAENQLLYNKLEEIERHSSGSDLMNLEMAEFDKTLINLNNQLLTKSSQIDDMETALKSKEQIINSFQQQLTDRENQNSFLEERSHKMKQLLVKTKRELADCKSEIEKLNTVNISNSERIELLINQMEETKFQLSEALNEKEKLIDHHATILKRLETISKNKDIRLVDLKSQLDSTINNYQLLQKEFDSYKVKAQNALSTQQRPKPTFSNFMTQDTCDSKNVEDADKKELKKLMTDLELVVKDLKIDLQESDDKNFSLKNEIDNLRWENEKWIEKYKFLAKENNELAQKYQQAVKETQEIDKIQKNSYSNFIEKYEVEKENLIKSYLKQIEINKSTFENQILNLEQKVSEIENEKLKYQEEIWTCREQLKNMENKNTQSQFTTDYPVSTAKYQSWSNNFKTPLEHERQQGEGMETTSEQDDIDSLNNQHLSPGITFRARNYNNVLIPLDKLLNSDDVSSRSAEEQINLLSTQVQSYKKKMEHLTEILNDSEATVSRLTEQAKILKAEIRRLEQNQDRESKLTDEPTHEYLKNVIMKFLDYETKFDERGQLVPVIVTLLSLNLHEKEKLITFSKIIQFDRKSNSEGWSSYFNWTGIS